MPITTVRLKPDATAAFGRTARRDAWWVQHITITEHAIIPLKERVVDEHYDPLRKVLRRVRKA